MKVFRFPEKREWNALIERPALVRADIDAAVNGIMEDVRANGDEAVARLTKKFDGAELSVLKVSEDEIATASERVDESLKSAIAVARRNIETFHRSQVRTYQKVETSTGINCWQRDVPIEKVGLYIPGGSAPLFSTVLMLAIPATIAGCERIVLCTPANANGKVADAILYTASLLGIKEIYKVGGAQAIAAMCFGTETIPKVDKLFGPGNQYVTKAKEFAQQYGVSIDMPAGPSELLVIADGTCVPKYVASDLLSQAEHGPDSQVVLVGNDEQIIADCLKEVERQVERLPRKGVAKAALLNSKAILLKDIDDCIRFSNQYAPEHLIIAAENAEQLALKVLNAGSVFIGNYSSESIGDYASGTNHTLPTNGASRSFSGVTLGSFCKTITFQHVSKAGLLEIGNAVELMAEAEGLEAHKNAVTIRLNDLKDV